MHMKEFIKNPLNYFFKSLCDGEAEKTITYFEENQQFGGASYVDAPKGRYSGTEQIYSFAQNWLHDFQADSASIDPITQTTSGGRSACEVIFILTVKREILIFRCAL